MGKLRLGPDHFLQRVRGSWLSFNALHMTLQTYEDYLEDVLSMDLPDGTGEKSLSTNMFDFLVKEEPLGEEDLRALQKDRQKKDNHNMSKSVLNSSSSN